MKPEKKDWPARSRADFIDSQISMFGKRGSPIGERKIIDFLTKEIEEAEMKAYERGFNDAQEKAAGLFVGGDGTTLFTNRQIIDCIRALKPGTCKPL